MIGYKTTTAMAMRQKIVVTARKPIGTQEKIPAPGVLTDFSGRTIERNIGLRPRRLDPMTGISPTSRSWRPNRNRERKDPLGQESAGYDGTILNLWISVESVHRLFPEGGGTDQLKKRLGRGHRHHHPVERYEKC